MTANHRPLTVVREPRSISGHSAERHINALVGRDPLKGA